MGTGGLRSTGHRLAPRAGERLRLLQCVLDTDLPAAMGILHRRGRLIVDDHFLLGHTRTAQFKLEPGETPGIGKRMVHEVLAERLHAEHAPQSHAPQNREQAQHHSNGTEHAKANRKKAHQGQHGDISNSS